MTSEEQVIPLSDETSVKQESTVEETAPTGSQDNGTGETTPTDSQNNGTGVSQTERQDEQSHLMRSRAGYKASVTKKQNELEDLLFDPSNLNLVIQKRDELEEAYRKFEIAHFKIASGELEDVQYLEREELSYNRFLSRLKMWIVTAEMNVQSDEQVGPGDSVSQHSIKTGSSSRHSTSSTVRWKQLEETAMRKGLEAKLDLMNNEQELMMRKIKLEQEEKMFRVQLELAQVRARELVYEEASSVVSKSSRKTKSKAGNLTSHRKERTDNPKNSHQYVSKQLLNPEAATWNPGHTQPLAVTDTCTVDVVTRMMNMQTTYMDHMLNEQKQSALNLTLPNPDVPVFGGNPLEYCSFTTAFDTLIQSRTTNDSSRLHYLLQYTTDDVQILMQSCLTMPPNEGYVEARRLLKQKYGQDYRIAAAMVDRITSGVPIKTDDSKCLDKYAVLLRSCMNTLNHIGYTSKVENPETMKSIVNKLPYDMRKRWRSRADTISEIEEREITFTDIVLFIEREARVVGHPIFGDITGSQGGQKPTQRTIPTQPKSSAFMSKSQNSLPHAYSQPGHGATYNNVSKCVICFGDHKLENCTEFKNKSYDERMEFAKNHGLCFNCLIPRHRIVDCWKRPMCTHCDKKHSSLLHRTGDSIQRQLPLTSTVSHENMSQSDVTNGYIDICNSSVKHVNTGCTKTGSSIGLPIIPMKVKGTSDNDPVVTFAFFDNGSNQTFCTDKLCEQLGVHGQNIKFCLTTLEKENSPLDSQVVNIQAYDLGENEFIGLCNVLTRPSLPINMQDIPAQEDVDRWPHLDGITLQSVNGEQIHVGLLIGNDNFEALEPLEIRHSRDGGPYAVRTRFGWVLNGPLGRDNVASRCTTNYIKSDVILDQKFREFCNREFNDSIVDAGKALSRDDEKALKIMEDSITFQEGHYQLALPLKVDPMLPNNKPLAEHRLQLLRKRLAKDEQLYGKYSQFMNDLLMKQYAELVPVDDLLKCDGRVWYLPHHPVFNPNKPNKLRVVFDCSAKYRNTSLNDQLLSGPDQTNTLVGVLLRFRQELVALTSDIESMFHQVSVNKEDRDLLRFLWYANGLDHPPMIHRMRVHLFGATSSPSCCNYALKKTADDHQLEYDPETIKTIKHNFYVDDCLKSVPNEDDAKMLVKELTDILHKGGFHLTKWVSNSQTVMEIITSEERAVTMKSLDYSTFPIERALGMKWDVRSDVFKFSVTIKDRPLTRRGVLSVMSSVYDPLGFITPFLLPVKLMLQEFCKLQLDWDDKMPDYYIEKWKCWLDDLRQLADFSIDRCMKSSQLDNLVSCDLHHFSDASELAYGVVSYVCFIDSTNRMHCSFVMGKSRVASIKKITVPRLELSAATLAVRQDKLIRQELELPIARSVYWTDSTSVLKFIRNTGKRFHTFIANRIAVIADGSDAASWMYVDTRHNPADDATRGLNVKDLVNGCRWITGPDFLWQQHTDWPKQPDNIGNLPEDHPEVKIEKICHATTATDMEQSFLDSLLTRFSSWVKLKKCVAWISRYQTNLMTASKNRTLGAPRVLTADRKPHIKPITVTEMNAAEEMIIRIIQRQHYPIELEALSTDSTCSRNHPIKRSSSIYKLSPVVLSGTLRVGGRLEYSRLDINSKHQYILPKNHPISTLIIRHFHHISGHSGREYVLGLIRKRYWIVHANALVRNVLHKCVQCRKVQGKVGQQMMGDLPEDRLQSNNPPFTFVGIDFFGPYLVKRGRSHVKRYGLLLTCLTTRAIHIEVTHSLDTDSVLHALSRFMARRGKPSTIRSDNAGCFVKAEKEIRSCIAEWNQDKLHEQLLQKDIQWIFNPPLGSHHGGVWERCIRTARKILSNLLQQQIVDDESLVTLMCEVEGIMNGRPITKVSGDPHDSEALTPNHLLLLRDGSSMPFATFKQHDLYYHRRWRQIQYLTDQFWRRWLREYMPMLQKRQKWNTPVDNFAVGDIVLLVDITAPRNCWPLGRVLEILPGRDKLVRKVKVRSKGTVYERPIDKLILLDNIHATESQ